MEGALASWPAEFSTQPRSFRGGGCLAGGAAAHPGLPERMKGPVGSGGNVPAQVHAPADPPAVALPLHTTARPVVAIAWPIHRARCCQIHCRFGTPPAQIQKQIVQNMQHRLIQLATLNVG